jgi:hypothetical protein
MFRNSSAQDIGRTSFFQKFTFENILVLGFLLYVFCYTVIPIFGHQFDRIPGDFTDARFNNYLLENGYAYLTQKGHDFWNAPFCYPEENVITYSDNFIAELPVYSVFRFCGLDNQSAYQGWMAVTLFLNFIVCAWVLYRLSRNKAAAMVGAFVFAFAIPVFDQNVHSQMMARYAIPLAFYYLILFLKEARHRYLLYCLLSLVLQFYNSIYLGFLLTLGLGCMLAGCILFYRKQIPFRIMLTRKQAGWYLLHGLISMSLLYLLMKPYIARSNPALAPPKEQIMGSLPEPRAYILTSWSATSWRDLTHVPEGMKDFWNKFLFPGGVGALAIIGLTVVLVLTGIRRIRIPAESRLRLGLGFLAGFFFLFILTIRVHQFSLYAGIRKIPGFNVMRDLCRVVNVQLFFYGAAAALLIALLLEKIRNTWLKNLCALILLVLVVVDNKYDPELAVTFSKKESTKRFMDLVDKVKAHPNYTTYEAMVYMPEQAKDYAGPVQLDAMLASQYLNIKTVNGYTGNCPEGFCEFAVKSNLENLKTWLDHKGLPTDSTLFLYIR